MKKLLLLILVASAPFLTYAQDLTAADVAAAVNIDQLEHPYVLFSQSDLPAIRARIENDEESGHIMDELLATCTMLRYMPIEAAVPPRPTHSRAGWTELDRENRYESKLNRYRTYAFELAFVYQVTGDESYAKKAYEFAEYICSVPTWTMQAHEFSIIYSRVMPWNVPDDQVNFNFDLGNATTGQTLALVYDWIYPALVTEQRDRIRGALLEKAITHVRGNYEFHWWATSYRCNWTGVCNGGLGIVALALLKDHPQLVDVVAESHNRIHKMIGQIGVDGGWQEGGGYWRFGMDRSSLFAIGLKRVTNGQYNLFKHERLLENPVAFPVYLYIPPNRSVNFGDAGDRTIGGTDFFNLLVQETQSPEGAWYRQDVLGEGEGVLDLVFPRPQVANPAPPKQGSRHFRTIDWWVMRSDFVDPDKVSLAGKAGLHDDPHHGHLDVGHFTLYWKGEAYLKDSGRPFYDEEYFDEERWNYPQAGSSGHNTLMVNGEQQIPGKLRRQPFNYEIGGKVLEFRTNERRDYVLMDPTNAYPKKELQQWRRHITLEKPQITFVLDEVNSVNKGAEVALRYHSEATATLTDNLALLQGKEGMMAMIPVCDEGFTLKAGKHAYQPIHATRKFEWIPYYDIMVQPKGAQSRVGTLVLPVLQAAEAQSIAQTLQMRENGEGVEVRFKYRKQSYVFQYVKGDKGLVLKGS